MLLSEKIAVALFISTVAAVYLGAAVAGATVLLERAGLMSPLYRACLVGYVTAWAQLVEIDERLDREGLILHTADGRPYKHPLCSLRKSASDFLLKVSCEFGMTPASRSRVTGAATPPMPKVRPEFHGHADYPVDAG